MKRVYRDAAALLAAALFTLPSSGVLAQSPQGWVWDFVDRQMMKFGSGRHLGVQVQSMTPELREFFGAPTTEGVLVASVRKDSVAGRAGVRVGDVIIAADDRRIEDPQDLIGELLTKQGGDKLTLTVVRDKAQVTLNIEPPPRRHPPAWMPAPPWWDEEGPPAPAEPDADFQQQLLDRLERLENKLEQLDQDR